MKKPIHAVWFDEGTTLNVAMGPRVNCMTTKHESESGEEGHRER